MRISDWSSDVCSSDLARRRLGLGEVDGRDGRVGEGAAHQHAVTLFLQPDVVAVLALDGQEAQVFHPAQALAYAKSAHGEKLSKSDGCLVRNWPGCKERRPGTTKEKDVTLL